MPKKSNSIAARYAEQSKKKKKKSGGPTPPLEKPADFAPREITKFKPSPGLSPPPKESATHPISTRQVSPNYRYVTAEMKMIGILTGAIFIILIVLGFTLR